jgi:glycosyltransferase involved in cell wall biosynthesis
MSTIDMAGPIPNIGPAFSAARSEAFLLTIVVPMYNEQESADPFFDALLPVLDALGLDACGGEAEVLCIDDGSTDATVERVLARQQTDPRIKLISFTRNFGKEAALSAGIDHCTGDAVLAIDADLQHPPELIAPMIERWREGYDIVAAVRRDRDGFLRGQVSKMFYRAFNRIAEREIPPEIGDFRLMDAAVAPAPRTLPERNRFMKSLFAWVGFKGATIAYDVRPRVGGTSAFGFWKLWSFALDGITAFSTWPLRIWSYIGLAIAALPLIYASSIIISTLVYGIDVPGFASLIVLILFLGSIQLISLGVLGEYVGRMLIEVKRRLPYSISRIWSAGTKCGTLADESLAR